ncbi:hypothetical protein O988_09100 [Pseudogymnoascus sp. VKM F-3808]|nr:hypothetical protein O988_09100 [Pseudogymnoascus sp. VKM F-3808]
MTPEDEHADAVVRVCSYHRKDFEEVMVHSRPGVTELVQNSLQTAFDISPATALDGFNSLPEELMEMILENVDIFTYFRLRQVDRFTRIRLTARQEYQLVAKHGLEGLRGLLRSGCASSFHIMDLYRALTTDRCAICREYGGFLFLLTVTRCCFNCLQSSPRLRVISTSDFAKTAGISKSKLSKSYGSTLRTVSGQYSTKSRRDLQVLWSAPGRDRAPRRRPKKLILEANAVEALESQAILKKNPISGLLGRAEEPNQRFMACVPFPSYDTSTGKTEHGVSCKGCQTMFEYGVGTFRCRNTEFSSVDFLFHFSHCGEARRIWGTSRKGTRNVKVSEFIKHNGCIDDEDEES